MRTVCSLRGELSSVAVEATRVLVGLVVVPAALSALTVGAQQCFHCPLPG